MLSHQAATSVPFRVLALVGALAQLGCATSSSIAPQRYAYLCPGSDGGPNSAPGPLHALSNAQRTHAMQQALQVRQEYLEAAREACEAGDIPSAIAMLLETRQQEMILAVNTAGPLPGPISGKLEQGIGYAQVATHFNNLPAGCRELAPELATLAFRYLQSAEAETRNPWQKSYIFYRLYELSHVANFPDGAPMLSEYARRCAEYARHSSTPVT